MSWKDRRKNPPNPPNPNLSPDPLVREPSPEPNPLNFTRADSKHFKYITQEIGP